MNTTFFVEYNAKSVAMYKSVKACLKFISRRGYVNDIDNTVRIFDKDGNMYHPITGKHLKYDTHGNEHC